MLRIIATLLEEKHFQEIQPRGERRQWSDKASDNLRILAPVEPWGKAWQILVRLEQGKRRDGVTYPKRLNFVCLEEVEGAAPDAKIVRERWSGNFAHSCETTLLFAAFPCDKENNWLMISIVKI